MFSSVYTGLSGLIAFSRGLDVISNNVGNLNTTGFKRTDIQFQDLLYRYRVADENSDGRRSSQIGNGVQASATTVNFSQGDLRSTGGDTDVAIDGNGLFIVRENNTTFYTRSGQFQFNQQGFLVTANGARVAGLNSSGSLTNISIDNLQINPARQTSTIQFRGNLSTGTTTFDIDNVNIFDSAGTTSQVSLTFTNNIAVTPGSWLVEIRDQNGTIVVPNAEIRFQGNGTPQAGFNTIAFTLTTPGGVNIPLTLNFGDPGSFNGATSFSAGATSDLLVDSQDGFGLGAITSVTFDNDGILNLNYSNAQTAQAGQLALAFFEDVQSLQRVGGGLFLPTSNQQPIIDRAGIGPFGTISGGSIELSNVDLTDQFTALIIVQRGFQASSQVLTVANEMVQQLLDDSRQS